LSLIFTVAAAGVLTARISAARELLAEAPPAPKPQSPPAASVFPTVDVANVYLQFNISLHDDDFYTSTDMFLLGQFDLFMIKCLLLFLITHN